MSSQLQAFFFFFLYFIIYISKLKNYKLQKSTYICYRNFKKINHCVYFKKNLNPQE